MSALFSLDGRLSVCASLVRKGAKLADVGTDHAYLPVWLAKNGLISSAVASDVRQKPLLSGAENIERFGCGDIVTTRLCSGLDGVMPEEADDIVIAGMGGELIAKIIADASWLRSPEKRLILQPMTKEFFLRRFLCESGFEILSETPCTHGGKHYTVICAEYSGRVQQHRASYYYIGELPDSQQAVEYIKQVRRKLINKRNGTAVTGGSTSELDEIIDDIDKRFFRSDENDNGF